MIAEYSVNLENRTKQELITMIEDAQKIIAEQQKEIEKIKEKQKLEHRIKTSLYDQIEIIKDELNVYKVYTKQNDLKDFNLFMNQNYISKDKIREKIKWVDEQMQNPEKELLYSNYRYTKNILNKLLEE